MKAETTPVPKDLPSIVAALDGLLTRHKLDIVRRYADNYELERNFETGESKKLEVISLSGPDKDILTLKSLLVVNGFGDAIEISNNDSGCLANRFPEEPRIKLTRNRDGSIEERVSRGQYQPLDPILSAAAEAILTNGKTGEKHRDGTLRLFALRPFGYSGALKERGAVILLLENKIADPLIVNRTADQLEDHLKQLKECAHFCLNVAMLRDLDFAGKAASFKAESPMERASRAASLSSQPESHR